MYNLCIKHFLLVLSGLVYLVALTACGQTGPLTLPPCDDTKSAHQPHSQPPAPKTEP